MSKPRRVFTEHVLQVVGDRYADEDTQQIADEAKIRADLLAGKLGKTPQHSVDDALAKWVEEYAIHLKSYANLLGKVRAVMDHTKGFPLSEISTVAQNLRAAGIKEGLKPATINRRLAILRRAADQRHARETFVAGIHFQRTRAGG